MIDLHRAIELFLALSYRRPMRVKELMVFTCGDRTDSYYLCPRCCITIEREFMNYCDRCGQCLDWSRHDWAKIVRPGQIKGGVRAHRL